MTRSNMILAAILVVQLGIAGLVYSGGSGAEIAKLEPILDLEAKDVTKLEVYAKDAAEKNDGAPNVVLDKSSGTWQLASHYNFAANGSKVDELITKLTSMKARGPIANKTATHRKFKVAEDKHERRVIIHRTSGEPVVLYVGGSAGQRQAAVRIKGQEKVYGATGVTAWGIATTAKEWVETEYFALVGGTQSIVINNGAGEFEFKREGTDTPFVRYAGDAEVPVPEGKELDQGKVAALGSKLANLQLAEPADPAISFGSTPTTVRIKAIGGDKEHLLTIGEEKDGRFPVRVDKLPPVWVLKFAVEDFVALDGEGLYKDPSAEPPPAMPSMPGGNQLPPEILRQLQQQGIAPPQ